MEEKSDINPESGTELTAEKKSQPKKKRVWLKRILWALLAGTGLIILIVAFFLGPIAKTLVNKFGASTLGVDKVSVDSITLYPFGGYVRVENLVVGKPITNSDADFSRDLLRLEYLEFDFAVRTALSQKKVIDLLKLKNLDLTYEQTLNGKVNVDELRAHLEKRFGVSGESESEVKAASESEEETEEMYLGAHYIDIENINIYAYIRGMPSAPFPPISFEFKDGIGLDEDLTPLEFGIRLAGNYMSVIRLFRGSAVGDFAGATADAVSDAANFTADVFSDAAKGTASVVSDAAGFAAGAAGVTANAVTDVAGATGEAISDGAKKVFNLFSSDKKEEKEDSDNEK